ncbi:hypothetical protein F8M41_018408 [Gigaspora margarita]|uniref:Uncharacterized protein n=1 Tax=Gigaspora margarita TaxID=4874 RepID=A0A8H4ALI0_GIGMA|nr:hypothetical protein F8M41_018408 [Gigaspora margarita]
MSTRPRAETSATTAQRNALQQRRLDNYDDLINFEPHEYDNGYTSSTYQEDTGRSFTPIPVRYEIRLDEGEEDDDRIVIMDPDDAPILPLHDVVTNNRYGNVDYQNEYEERYLQQRADRTYAYGYQRPQINDPIIDLLEPGTQPENNRFLQTPQVRFDNPSPTPPKASSNTGKNTTTS